MTDDPDPSAAASPGGSPASDDVRYEVSGGLARITIDRPDRRNAMTWEVVATLRACVAAAKADPAARVVVLSGAGDRAFCAGADLAHMAGEGVYDLHRDRGQLADLFRDLWGLGKPTIARVQGYALAGGFGLALACDLVVAADDAVFGASEIDVGLWPYMITVPLLRSMPPKRVLELMMTGRRVGAAEGERLGFVTQVTPVGGLDAAVDELAATLASKSSAVMALGRDSFYAVWDQAGDDALRLLHPLLGLATQLDDATEGMAAFREKRPPRWRDR